MRNVYFESDKNRANIPLFARTFSFAADTVRRFPDFYHPEVSPDTRVCFWNHFHRSIEIQHVMQGAMQVEVGEDTFVAQAGDILMFNSRETHFGCVNASLPYVKYTYLLFDSEKLALPNNNGILSELAGGKSTFVRCIRSEEAGRLIDEIAALISECSTDGVVSVVSGEAELRIMMLFYGALHEIVSAGGIRRDCRNVPTLPDFTLHMSEYIERHYMEEITMEMLCEKFLYNPSYFCRLFKKHFGKPFFNYLEEYRITKAVNFLIGHPDERISIGELAALVGFPDYSRFSHSFKKIVGVSPTEYRKARASRTD